MQWHPIFAHLLRPLLEEFYEVTTEVPVGDLPRQADMVLVHRTAPAPFVGIWRHLTTWNVLEVKGPTDPPSLRDLDELLEVGLGIDRRLNEKRREDKKARLGLLERSEVSWWYLANHVGQRFLAEVQEVLGREVTQLGAGLWRCPALGRTLYVVSRDGLPIEPESMPLHLVTEESEERLQALARKVVEQPGLWDTYGAWLALLRPQVSAEVERMLQTLGKEPNLDFRPLIERYGLEKFIDQIGLEKLIDKIGLQKVIDQFGLQKVIDQFGLQKVIDQIGAQKVIDQIGVQKVIETIGTADVLRAVGVERFLAALTPEQLQEELKRRLP